jgi:lipoprotein NlpI
MQLGDTKYMQETDDNIYKNFRYDFRELMILFNRGDFLNVCDFGKCLLKKYPFSYDVLITVGVANAQIGQLERAKCLFQRAIRLRPKYVEAYINLGNVLGDLKEHDAAINIFKIAVSLDPRNAEAYFNLGIAFKDNNLPHEAIDAYRRSLLIMPEYVEPYNNLGTTLKDLGRYQEALDAYGSAITVKPDYAEAYNNLGRLYWLMQDFTRAFELMEWRWHVDGQSIGKKLESIHPTWSGEEGAEVFVWKEQGIGDEIMFGSMLSEINKKSKKLIVECDNRLIPLYERSFSRDIRFIDDRYKLSDFDYDCQIAIGSLPKHFRHKLEDFSTVSPGWLKADLDRTNALREKLQAQTKDKIIGISWFTNSASELSYKRNIPLELLAEYLKRVPGKYVSLQYGDTAEEILEVKNQVNFELNTVDEIDLYNDIDGLAALISACDTVISIDNLTVHLAGALGVDTRALLPEVPRSAGE